MTFFPKALKSGPPPPHRVSARNTVGYILYTRRSASGTLIEGVPKTSVRMALLECIKGLKKSRYVAIKSIFMSLHIWGGRSAYRHIRDWLFPDEFIGLETLSPR
jgi:hypothetical protein